MNGCRVAITASLLALSCWAAGVHARPWSEIAATGSVSICASADSLPYAADKADMPGFQIEIARALATRLGVSLHVDWIASRRRAGVVDCDLMLDTIVDPEANPRSLRLSNPYHVSGVALAFAPGRQPVKAYDELAQGVRVGVMMNSLASRVVSRTNAAMVPFAFEEDLVSAVASGDVYAGALSIATIGYHNVRNPEHAIAMVQADEASNELRWSVAVGMRRADDELAGRVNAALALLLDDGSIAMVYRRYGVAHQRP